jgi:hypothetical protein
MAYGDEVGGFGSEIEASGAAAGAAAGVEAAGGMEMAGADMAAALADALAGANVDDFGSYAAQDAEARQGGQLSPGEEQRNEAAIEAEAQAAAQAAYDDVIGSSTGIAQANIAALGGFQDQSGPPGYEAPGVGTGVEDFSSGGYATAPATSDLSFSAYGQQTQPGMSSQEVLGSGFAPSQDFLSPGEQGRVDAAGQFDFASPTAAGTPGYAQPGSAWGQGQVEDFTGGGMPQAAPVGIEEMEMGMAAPMGSGAMSPNTGMITAGTGPYGDPASRAGAITAGSQEMDEGTLDPNAGGVSAPAGTAGTQAQISQDVNAVKQEAAQYVTPTQTAIDLEVQNTSARLDQEAAQKREQHGTLSKEYQKAQRIANAFKTLDAYSKSYASVHGKSFLGELLGGKFSLLGAVKSVEGWLQDKFGGQVPGETGEQLAAMLEEAYSKGTLNEVLRDLNQAGEGGMEAEMAVQEEVSSFIQRYPWAAELDPKYIKYLIDNPAELQDLLGENEGG